MAPSELWLALSAISSGLLAAWVVLAGRRLARRRRVARRLSEFLPERREGLPRPRSWARRLLRVVGREALRRVGARGQAAWRRALERAGWPGGLGPDEAAGARVVLMLAGGVLAGTLVLASGWGSLAPALALAAAGVVGPEVWLARRAEARRRRIERDLPLLADLLYLCLQAGMGLTSGLQEIARSMWGPLGEELRLFVRDYRDAGLSQKEALLAMAERTGSAEVRLFADAVVQALELGSGLLVSLESLSSMLRQQRRRLAEAQVRRAPVRMVLPLVLCILPVLMLIVLGPPALRLAGVYPRTFGP